MQIIHITRGHDRLHRECLFRFCYRICRAAAIWSTRTPGPLDVSPAAFDQCKSLLLDALALGGMNHSSVWNQLALITFEANRLEREVFEFVCKHFSMDNELWDQLGIIHITPAKIVRFRTDAACTCEQLLSECFALLETQHVNVGVALGEYVVQQHDRHPVDPERKPNSPHARVHRVLVSQFRTWMFGIVRAALERQQFYTVRLPHTPYSLRWVLVTHFIETIRNENHNPETTHLQDELFSMSKRLLVQMVTEQPKLAEGWIALAMVNTKHIPTSAIHVFLSSRWVEQ